MKMREGTANPTVSINPCGSVRCMWCEEWHPGIFVHSSTPTGERSIPVAVCLGCLAPTLEAARQMDPDR